MPKRRLQCLHFLFVAAIIAVKSAVYAQDAPVHPIIPLREDCRAEEAVPVDMKAFAANPEKFLGKCVRVRGVIAFRSFYPDLESLYTRHDGNSVIAIYPYKLIDETNLWGQRTFADIVAYTYSCSEYYRLAQADVDRKNAEAKTRGENGQWMVFISGECHYGSPGILWVSSWKPIYDTPARLTLSAPRRFRDLEESTDLGR